MPAAAAASGIEPMPATFALARKPPAKRSSYHFPIFSTQQPAVKSRLDLTRRSRLSIYATVL
jgi:hypothetical protein